MTVDDIKRYSVMLGRFGSGVLFQANIAGDTYILTAKHNLKHMAQGQTVDITFNTLQENNWGSRVLKFTREDNINCFVHTDEHCDAAILKVPYQPGYDQIIVQYGFENKLKYMLCGYPLDKIKLNPTHEFAFKPHLIEDFNDSKNFLQGAITKKNVGQENLMGISGGGIFGLTENQLVLLGIQSKIAKSVHPDGEFDYVPICHFNEIIESCPKEAHLDLLLPGYMKDLMSLGSHIMELKECFDKGFQATIRAIVDEKLAEIKHSPLEIMKSSIKNKMLVANENEIAYQSRVLWSSWLEYLLVLTVAGKDLVEMSSLETLYDSCRIIHSETKEPWVSIIENILKTNFEDQPKGSIVLVSTEHRPSANFCIENAMLDSIADVRSFGININQSKQLSNVSKFVHISAFENECIVKNERDLSKLKGTKAYELVEAIKTKFNELLSN